MLGIRFGFLAFLRNLIVVIGLILGDLGGELINFELIFEKRLARLERVVFIAPIFACS